MVRHSRRVLATGETQINPLLQGWQMTFQRDVPVFLAVSTAFKMRSPRRESAETGAPLAKMPIPIFMGMGEFKNQAILSTVSSIN